MRIGRGRSRSSPRPRKSDARLAKAESARPGDSRTVVGRRVAQSALAAGSELGAAVSLLGQLAGAWRPCTAARRRVPAADEHRALPAPRRQSGAARRRAAGLDVLDRRRHRRVRQRAPLPQRRPAAAAGRGARRGDDQLLRLSLRAAGEPRHAVPRGHRTGAGAVESAGAAAEDRHQGLRSRGRASARRRTSCS